MKQINFIKLTKLSNRFFLTVTGIFLISGLAYGQAIQVNSDGEVGINYAPSSNAILFVVGDANHSYAMDVVGDASFGKSYHFKQKVSNIAGIGCDWSSGNTLKVVGGSEINALKVDGACVLTEGWSYSDERLKKNIENLSYEELLTKIMNIDGKQFMYKNKEELEALNSTGEIQFDVDTIRDTDSLGKMHLETVVRTPDFSKGKKYGLIAQDLLKEFPELVRLDSTDMTYGINYTGFIPILLEVVKHQQTALQEKQQDMDDIQSRLTALESDIQFIKAQCCNDAVTRKKSATAADDNMLENDNTPQQATASLAQNIPNPFTENTEISYFLPNNAGEATLYIYNMQGSQIASYPINHTGHGSITINGGELNPGMYFYTLIAGDAEVDTKRMILTE